MSQGMRKDELENVRKPMIDAEKDEGCYAKDVSHELRGEKDQHLVKDKGYKKRPKKGFREKMRELKDDIVGPVYTDDHCTDSREVEEAAREKGHDGYRWKEGEKPHDSHRLLEGEKPHDSHGWKESEKVHDGRSEKPKDVEKDQHLVKDQGSKKHQKKGLKDKVIDAVVGPVYTDDHCTDGREVEEAQIEKARDGWKESEKPHDSHGWKGGEKPRDSHGWKGGEKPKDVGYKKPPQKGLKEKAHEVKDAALGPVYADDREVEKHHDGRGWKQGEKLHDGHGKDAGVGPVSADGREVEKHEWKESEKPLGHGGGKPYTGPGWPAGGHLDPPTKKDIVTMPSGYGEGKIKKKHFGEKIVGPDPLSQELQTKTKDLYDASLASHDKGPRIASPPPAPLCKEIRAHANKIPHAPTLRDEDIKNASLGLHKHDNLSKDEALQKDKGLHKGEGLHKDELQDKGLHKEAHQIPKAPTLHDKDIESKADKAIHKDKGLKDKGFKDKGLKDKGRKEKGFKEKGGKDKGFKDKGFKDEGLKDEGFRKDDAHMPKAPLHDRDIEDKGLHKDEGFHKDAPVASDKGFGKEIKQDNVSALSGQGKEHEWNREDQPYDTTHGEQEKGIVASAKDMVQQGLDKVKSIFKPTETAAQYPRDVEEVGNVQREHQITPASVHEPRQDASV